MSYTSHTWIRIFPIDEFPQTLLDDTLSILIAQTFAYEGDSHNTPLYIKQYERYIDIQIGFKGWFYPPLENLWTYLSTRDFDFDKAEELMRCKLVHKFEEWETYNLVSEIWYRVGDGDKHVDYIGCFSKSEKWKLDLRTCRYAFDKVMVNWNIVPDEILDKFEWIKSGSQWELRFNQEYRAFNSRFSSLKTNSRDRISYESPTTDITGYATDECWFSQFSDDNPDLLGRVVLNGNEISCYYRNRVVKIIRFYPEAKYAHDRFVEYNFDYWDNCINPEWLAYKQQNGLDK